MRQFNTPMMLLAVLAIGISLAWWIDHNRLRRTIHELRAKDIAQEVHQCNQQELGYFSKNWPELHDTLQRLAATGSLSTLPKAEQEELWDELAYLQGCRHPSIMRDHGDDILEIMYTLDLPDRIEELQAIYPQKRGR